MRHEATFHYQLKPTRTRILDVPDDAIRSLYMHETPGNQFFPYGEEAIFVSMLDEIANESDKSMVAGDVIKAWAEWTLEAIRAANDLFSDFFVSFVEPHTNGRKPKEASYWLDPSLVGTVGEYKTPVFVRQE